MITFIYEWIENIAFYLVVLVAVMQMIPKSTYQKYVHFFAGLILILMLIGPIIKLFGMTDYQSMKYHDVAREIEEEAEYMERIIREEEALGK